MSLSDNFLKLKFGKYDVETIYIQPPLRKETSEALDGEELSKEMDHGVSYDNKYINITIQFDAGETKAILKLIKNGSNIMPEYTIPVKLAKELMEQLEEEYVNDEKLEEVNNQGGGKSKKLRRKSRKTKTTRRRKTVSRRR